MADDDTEDLDRAAILARRQHFIALALSGLATTSACTKAGEPSKDGKPTPSAATTRGTQPVERRESTSETGGETGEGTPQAAPRPCLSEVRLPKQAPKGG
jgi:hypothetical protein